MSIHLRDHAFAANPLRGISASTSVSPSAAADALRSLLDTSAGRRSGRRAHSPLQDPPFPPRPAPGAVPGPSSSSSTTDVLPSRGGDSFLVAGASRGSRPRSSPAVPSDAFVFLVAHGEEEGKESAAYWAVDVSEVEGARVGGAGDGSAFLDLRTLMVATDWRDKDAMGDLAIAGHARALLEWHSTSKFCGACGASAAPAEAGRRRKCSNESCKKRIYPRVDPVVIMLVIDKENDRALLSLGLNTMPCQLMVGFFAYAKSLEIHVDMQELEGKNWNVQINLPLKYICLRYK
ncbi:hypothetical protein ABZP36_012704 [Zizania latifolia]